MENIDISGMLSPACAEVISSLILSFPGVENVTVDFISAQATINYDLSQYSVELADSIAIAIEREGYIVICNHGVTIQYVLMRQVVTTASEVAKIHVFFEEQEWVSRVHVDVLSNTAAVFVRAQTPLATIAACLTMNSAYQQVSAERDVRLEVTCSGDEVGEDGATGLSGSRSGAHRLYNILKTYTDQSARDESAAAHSYVSSVYVNASSTPPRARVKGSLTLAELASFLCRRGYEVQACAHSRLNLHPVQPARCPDLSARSSSGRVASACAFFAAPMAEEAHRHVQHGGFFQVSEGAGEGQSANDVASSLESVESHGSNNSGSLLLTPPRDLGATPLTWKANHLSPQPQAAASSQSSPTIASSQSYHDPDMLGNTFDSPSDRRGSQRPKKSRAPVIQIGHTANRVVTFSLGGRGAQDLRAEQIRQIEDELRRQRPQPAEPALVPLRPGIGIAIGGRKQMLRSGSGPFSGEKSVESMAAAVPDINVLIFEEKVEILYDSSLLQWPAFVESISRAGFQATLVELRRLSNHRDLRTRRFLLSSNTADEDIRQDLFSGGAALEGTGGVMGVRWLEDGPETRADIRVLLPSAESASVLTGGTFVVLEVVYDSLVLPLFELHEILVMSSSNRLDIFIFPSNLFIRRLDVRIPPTPEAASPPTSSSSSPAPPFSTSTSASKALSPPTLAAAGPLSCASAISDEDAVMRAKRVRLEHIQAQCGIACALTAALLLNAVYNPLGDDGSWAVDETAQRKVFVKLGVYELVSLALTTCIVYCPGSTMTKDTCVALKTWQGICQNPYLLIGLGCWSAYALGLMSLLTVVIYLHLLGGRQADHHYLTSLGLGEIRPVEYFVLTAMFVSCYLGVMVFNARNHFKWPIPGSKEERTAHEGGASSTSDADTIDLLAQTFLLLRPQFCALLIVDYPAGGGGGAGSTRHKKSRRSSAGTTSAAGSYDVIKEKIISSEVLKSGDLVCVKRGEVIPADGEVVRGKARVEEGLLSGELTVLDKDPGDYVLGGSTLLECDSAGVHVLVRCEVEQSVLEQLLCLCLQSAFDKRHRSYRKRISETGEMLWETVGARHVGGGPLSHDQKVHVASYQFFPLASPWQFVTVKTYNLFVLLLVSFMWVSWNIYGVIDLVDLVSISGSHHFGVMFFWIHFIMSMSLAASLFLLACPVMLGILFANAFVLFLASQISFARFGIGIQPARALLRRVSRVSSLVWSKQSLSEPHLEVTNVYLLSGYGSGLVLVRGQKWEGLDAIDKLSVEGIRPLHSFIDSAISCSASSDHDNDDEYINEDLVAFMAGAAQLPLQHERPAARAVTNYAAHRLSEELVMPTTFEVAPCGGVKCSVILPPALAALMGGVRRPVEVVTGSLDFLRHERIRFSANSLFGNMANLAQKTHGAGVLFVAINGQVSGMLQIQRRVLPDAEVTVRAFEARKIGSWLSSGDPLRCNIAVGLQAGISSPNVVSDVYPQHLKQLIDRLQRDDNEVVGYVMPGVDEVGSHCDRGGGAGAGAGGTDSGSSSRKNMFFLGKLLHSMPAMFQADVSVCRRTASQPCRHQPGTAPYQHAQGGGEMEVDVARRLFESASDVVLLAQSASFSHRHNSSHAVGARSGASSSASESASATHDDTSTYRMFGLVAVIDLSEKIDHLLRIIINTLMAGGLVWLVCVLVMMYIDAVFVVRATVLSAVLNNSHTSTMVDFLLLCWLPLYPPGTVCASTISIYIFSLFGCIVTAELVYVLGYYRPPVRQSYLGLTSGNSNLDFSSAMSSPMPFSSGDQRRPASLVYNISSPYDTLTSPVGQSASSFDSSVMMKMLSFTKSDSDARASLQGFACRLSQSSGASPEEVPLLATPPSSKTTTPLNYGTGGGVGGSYGSRFSAENAMEMDNSGKDLEYCGLELESDEFDV